MKHIKTYDELNESIKDRVTDWWTRPRNQGMSDNGSPKDIYDYDLKWILAIPLLGTNLIIEYGYKSILNLINKYGKPLKDLVKKIQNDPIISEYLNDPNFKIDLSEEEGSPGQLASMLMPGYEDPPKTIVFIRLKEILNKKEWSLFMKYIYYSQKILKNQQQT